MSRAARAVTLILGALLLSLGSTTAFAANSSPATTGLAPVITTDYAHVYTCPTGATLSGTLCRGSSVSYAAAASSSYYCLGGATLNGSTCLGSVKIYPATSHTVSTSPACPSGGSIIAPSTNCTMQQAAYPVGSYCSSPFLYLYGNTCYDTRDLTFSGTLYPTEPAAVTPPGIDYLQKYNCPPSSPPYASKNTQSWGAYCYSPTDYTNTGTKYLATVALTCGPSMTTPWTLTGKTCHYSYPASSGSSYTSVYTCPKGGSLVGANCALPQTTTPALTKTKYSCLVGGTLYGSTCKSLPTTTPATVSAIYLSLYASHSTLITVNSSKYLGPIQAIGCLAPYLISASGPGGTATKILPCPTR